MENRMISINPLFLEPHPVSRRIYGVVPDDELVESVRANGVKERICVLSDTKTVFSGYRRARAALQAGLTLVPVEVFDLSDDLEIRKQIIARNVYNERSAATRASELAELEAIASESSDPGRSRDKAAEMMGVSPRMVGMAKQLDSILQDAREEGDQSLIDNICRAKTISAALKVARGGHGTLAVVAEAAKDAEPIRDPDDKDLAYLSNMHREFRLQIAAIKKQFTDISLTPLGQYIAHAHGRLIRHLSEALSILSENTPVLRDPADGRIITKYEQKESNR